MTIKYMKFEKYAKFHNVFNEEICTICIRDCIGFIVCSIVYIDDVSVDKSNNN